MLKSEISLHSAKLICSKEIGKLFTALSVTCVPEQSICFKLAKRFMLKLEMLHPVKISFSKETGKLLTASSVIGVCEQSNSFKFTKLFLMLKFEMFLLLYICTDSRESGKLSTVSSLIEDLEISISFN
uniref:Uncharacterized protein n=1 Tax=Cacopsylla melanoneura TaxID=428564 RepID=A0A8D9ARK2_9HEMI